MGGRSGICRKCASGTVAEQVWKIHAAVVAVDPCVGTAYYSPAYLAESSAYNDPGLYTAGNSGSDRGQEIGCMGIVRQVRTSDK